MCGKKKKRTPLLFYFCLWLPAKAGGNESRSPSPFTPATEWEQENEVYYDNRIKGKQYY